MQRIQRALLAGLLMASGAGTAHALPISGVGAVGSFTGDIIYAAASDVAASLSINLINTSLAANTGFITAFVLNNPSQKITGISNFADAPGGGVFGVLGLGNGTVGGSPHGLFDFGAAIGGSFQGSGPPGSGIAAGATDSFAFSLTGNGLLSLTAGSFMGELSTGTGGGAGYKAFLVRYRGFESGESDKVAAMKSFDQVIEVPEPVSIAVLAIGLAGIGFAWRWRLRA